MELHMVPLYDSIWVKWVVTGSVTSQTRQAGPKSKVKVRFYLQTETAKQKNHRNLGGKQDQSTIENSVPKETDCAEEAAGVPGTPWSWSSPRPLAIQRERAHRSKKQIHKQNQDHNARHTNINGKKNVMELKTEVAAMTKEEKKGISRVWKGRHSFYTVYCINSCWQPSCSCVHGTKKTNPHMVPDHLHTVDFSLGQQTSLVKV